MHVHISFSFGQDTPDQSPFEHRTLIAPVFRFFLILPAPPLLPRSPFLPVFLHPRRAHLSFTSSTSILGRFQLKVPPLWIRKAEAELLMSKQSEPYDRNPFQSQIILFG
ncbi:hypothetical protein K1719_039002 [Acacia pycnantha]|nr:hypothetical protein K1719_039002 [Acacia pycnantha]